MIDKSELDKAAFALKHGKNTSDRLVPDIMQGISDILDGNRVFFNGRSCAIKKLGEVRQRDGEWRFSFDVLNPDETFDHIEFTVTKTGWGRGI